MPTANGRACCQCSDDEAHKYGECFCLCHTRAHQPPPPGERGCVICGKHNCRGHRP